ncbi:hypothetical protein LJB83_01455 [Clostridia bacterium OttesenSCG-928-F22]|nr:hypothetical protein [Clostridia bacterium OttesenSCG-928-F22]
MTVLRQEKVVDTIISFVHQHEITKVIMGRAPVEDKTSIVAQIKRRLPDIEVHVL